MKNWLLLTIACSAGLLSGCGNGARPAPHIAPSNLAAAQHHAAAAPLAQPAEPVPPLSPAQLAVPERDEKEFDGDLKRLLVLEEDGRFDDAIKLSLTLLGAYRRNQLLAAQLRTHTVRLRDEALAANSLGFAADSLNVPDCAALAEACFREAGDAGRILLRKALRSGGDDVASRACNLLIELRDSHIQRLCAERLLANPDDLFLHCILLNALRHSINRVDPSALPGLYKMAKQDFKGRDDIVRYIVSAVRRSGDDRPEAVARLLGDPNAWQELGKLGVWTEIPTESLAVHFKFDEREGARAANAVNVGNTATQGSPAEVTAPAWVPGKFGGALQCNGRDSIAVLNDRSLELGKDNADFSVAFWFCLKEDHNGNWRSITHKGNNDDERTFAMWVPPDSNRVHYRISTLAGHNEGGDSSTELRLNEWTHIAYVKFNRKLMLYLNGKKDAEVDLGGPVIPNTGPLCIGKDANYLGAAGIFDDYRIYTRALTENEIKLLFEMHNP